MKNKIITKKKDMHTIKMIEDINMIIKEKIIKKNNKVIIWIKRKNLIQKAKNLLMKKMMIKEIIFIK